jgi:hypothetical protein
MDEISFGRHGTEVYMRKQSGSDIARIRGLNVLIHVGHVYRSPARNCIRVPEDEV